MNRLLLTVSLRRWHYQVLHLRLRNIRYWNINDDCIVDKADIKPIKQLAQGYRSTFRITRT